MPTNHHTTYEGYESFTGRLKMTLKMISSTLRVLLILHLVTGAGWAWIRLPEPGPAIITTWAKASVLSILSPRQPISLILQEDEALALPPKDMYKSLQPIVMRLYAGIKKSFLQASWVWALLPLIFFCFRWIAIRKNRPQTVKGSSLLPPAKLLKLMIKNGEELDLPFGEVKQPRRLETMHTFFSGTTGAGKTVFLSHIIERIILRGDRTIIHDCKGDFIPRFYRPGQDFIFNPLDARCVGWNIFNEIKTPMDIDAIGISLIPEAKNSEPYWSNAARDVFCGAMHYCWQHNLRTNRGLWEVLTDETEQLALKLKNTVGAEAGHKAIQDPHGKQAQSVISTLLQYIKAFQYFSHQEGTFSIREFMAYGDGNIFISSHEEVRETMRPIISLFIDLLGRAMLSLPISPMRRVFFLIDELGNLQQLPTLVRLLTLSREKGGCCFLGIQDIGQITNIYGRDGRETIINCCNSSMYLRVIDPETRKFISDAIGETVVRYTKKSESMGPGEHQHNQRIAFEEKQEPLVAPAELKNLSDLTGYVSFAGYPLAKTSFPYKQYENREPPFVLRPDLLLNPNSTGKKDDTREIYDLLSGEMIG